MDPCPAKVHDQRHNCEDSLGFLAHSGSQELPPLAQLAGREQARAHGGSESSPSSRLERALDTGSPTAGLLLALCS